MCRWAARLAASLDRRDELAVLPLGDEDAEGLLAAVEEERRTECWWLVLRDGTPIPGDRGAGVALFSEVALTRPLGRLLGGLGLSPLVDAADRLVSRHRAGLGRFVPDGPAPRRYP